jgi:hypothetical protein
MIKPFPLHPSPDKTIDILALIAIVIFGVLYANITAHTYLGKAAIAGAVATLSPTAYLSLRTPK